MKTVRKEAFIPQDTLQNTADLPSIFHIRCPEGHVGPFRPIRIGGEKSIGLQCRCPGSNGHCDQRFSIAFMELTVLVNADICKTVADALIGNLRTHLE